METGSHVPRLDGFDVYHGNGMPGFDWEGMVVKYGITLGCCKVSEGVTFIDPAWAENRWRMHLAGLRYVGMYHWLSPDSSIEAQLRNFQRIGVLMPTEFTMLDLEPTKGKPGPSKQMCLDACAAWEAAYPGRFIRYQGKFFAGGDTDEYAAWPWWLAYYGPSSVPATHLPVTIWQWGGKTLGVEHFDSNQIIDLGALERLAGYTTTPPVPVEEEAVFEGFVKAKEDGTFWARGVDFMNGTWKQWACRIQELGIAWELYNIPLAEVPLAALEAVHRLPVGPVSVTNVPTPVDHAELADHVADELSRRLNVNQ